MPNPPQFLGSTSNGAWSSSSSQTVSASFTPTIIGGIPVGSLLLLAAVLELDPSTYNGNPPSFINLPTPGTWTPVFNYAVTTPAHCRFALMYKWADSNDASPQGQTYTITAGYGPAIYGATNRRSGFVVQVWNNVNQKTPVVLIQSGIYLAVTPQNTVVPPITSAVPDAAFGYFVWQVTIGTIPEGQIGPPSVSGWNSTGLTTYLEFYTRQTLGTNVFPGATYSVDSATYSPGTANSLVIVPAGDPAYPSNATPTPQFTRSRAVPLAIAGPRLNEVTAAYKPVIRVY